MRQSIVLSAILFFVALAFNACNRCATGCENGTCIKKLCECDVWYSGDACNKSQLLKYEGNYAGKQKCGAQEQSISFQLTVDKSSPDRLQTNLGYLFQFNSQTRFEVIIATNTGESLIGEGEMLVDLISFKTENLDSVQTTICLTTAALVP
ncbi:MAG: hypothetical protein NWQ55_09880 [Salibacteraceae bacterium]|nr:hypothetical protein [Salibacteraceae bacterium]MDP4686720.1 hypothetical protein [Salibacteraceae bacterium]MDP4763847.1 hypothetical protein [Salibacteraceae bacterium]MDP4843352.1 hypothetical protein [Salibacteraceae bacterium]MDP4935652.1 hypothetical protein [Salibacteraceae bacterium]